MTAPARIHLPVVQPDGDGYLVDGERVTMPTRYSECQSSGMDGVCPWARCRFNLMVDVDDDEGTIGLNYGRVMSETNRREARVTRERPRDLTEADVVGTMLGELVDWWVWLNGEHHQPTCAIWWADNGGDAVEAGMTLEEVGDLLNVTRERVRQIETRAIRRLKEVCERRNVEIPLTLELRHALDRLAADHATE